MVFCLLFCFCWVVVFEYPIAFFLFQLGFHLNYICQENGCFDFFVVSCWTIFLLPFVLPFRYFFTFFLKFSFCFSTFCSDAMLFFFCSWEGGERGGYQNNKNKLDGLHIPQNLSVCCHLFFLLNMSRTVFGQKKKKKKLLRKIIFPKK